MPKIQLLNQELINKIAAGEVVERPASVVKELIENSLDAGATSIQVDIEEGGMNLIRIIDNGVGMNEEDAKMAMQRHATSKISSLHDLQMISTMGFRGEALAAISSVSQFRLLTKQDNADSAIEVISLNDEIQTKPSSGVTGTTIEVKGLFHSVPARKKFMKSATTEFRHILSILINQAMLTPHISWKLTNNGKEVFHYQTVDDWKNRVVDILGKELTDQMIEVKHQRGAFILSGFILHPSKARDRMKEQYLFVNKRPVSDYMITKAVKEGFHNHIPHNTKPGFVLQVSIAPDLVDVNVHPRKSEVKFADPASVYREVLFGVKNSLKDISADAVQGSSTLFSAPISSGMRRSQGSSSGFQSSKPSGGQIKHSNTFSNKMFAPSSPVRSQNYQPIADFGSESVLDEQGWVLMGQAHDSYLIVQTPDGMIFVDQHAVAEKVLFEELIQHLTEPKVQSLLVPALIELSPEQKALVVEHEEALSSVGIEGELFGGNSYRLSGIPQNVKVKEIKTFLKAILDDMSDEAFVKAESLQKRQEELAKMASCRGAIKFGDVLTPQEQIRLLEDMINMNITACCHGRPVMFEIKKDKLNKEFGRP